MPQYNKGIKVGMLINVLKKFPKDKQFVVSSDEEQNTIFKGVYIEHYKDCVLIAGLSGLEFDEEN